MKFSNYKSYVVLLAFFTSHSAYAQRDYTFENHYVHESLIFPAATGINYYPVAGFSHRKQWSGLTSSPETFCFGTNFRLGRYDFYTPKMLINKSGVLNKERIGFGLSFVNDENGPLISNKFQFSYAYHLPFEWSTVSLGMDFSYNNIRIDFNQLSPINPADPSLNPDEDQSYYFQTGFGMQVSNETFFTSVAVRNLFRNAKLSKLGFEHSRPDYYLYSGVTWRFSRNFTLEPAILLMKQDALNFGWNPNLKLNYKSYNWAAVSYWSSGKIGCNFVFQMLKRFQIGYGYEFYMTNLSRGSFSCHSIYLGRNFGLRNLHGIRKNVNQNFL